MIRALSVSAVIFCFAHCGSRRVTVAGELTGGLKSGDLLLEYRAPEQQLRLQDLRHNRVILRLPLSPGFIVARHATDAVSESLASFQMHEVVHEHCELVRILSGSASGDRMQLAAELVCPDGPAVVDIAFVGEPGQVALQIKPRDARLNRLIFRFQAEEHERIFGGGVQFTHLDLRGHRLPILSEEAGVGRGAQPLTFAVDLQGGTAGSDVKTYAPVPFFMTSAFRSFETAQTAYQLWDFQGDVYGVEIWDHTLELRFGTAPAYSELIRRHTERSGRMSPLPDWASGTILGLRGGKEKVEQVLKAALKAKNPVTAIWLQDWTDSLGSQPLSAWLPDEKTYPAFRAWVQQLRGRGIRVLGYVSPLLAETGEIFTEANEKGYLVCGMNGKPYPITTGGSTAYLIDLSKRDAREFMRNAIRAHLLANGLAGYLADCGECLPMNARLASGERAALWHNRYPVEWARLNREAIGETGSGHDTLFFMRAGFAGASGHATLFWLGEQTVTFDEYDGLGSAVTGLITGGLSGITISHSDIGGLRGVESPVAKYHRSRELFLRWAEFAVFTPFFRTHPGSLPLQNYQAYSDDSVVAEFAALGRQHLALKPYFSRLLLEAARSGLPPVRPVFLHYPADEQTYGLRHEFLLGRDLMVAPVVRPDALTGRVYLPADTWIESSTGNEVAGPRWYTFAAPPGKPVAFIRANAAQRDLLLRALRWQG